MKTTVGYYETFPLLGTDRWQKLPLETEIDLGIDLSTATDEEVEEAMKKVRRVQYILRRQVQSFFHESNAAEKKEQAKEKESAIPETPEQREAKIIADIYTCKELKVLESYRLIAKNYPAIMAAFEQQEQKLKQ